MGAMQLGALQFLAILLTALALVPGGAHLFALPNKIGMSQEAYFIAQSVYSGWALFGIVLFGALAANVTLAIMARGRPMIVILASIAAICIAATLVIFFIWTYPANEATANWTVATANWQQLRAQWEVSHAINAAVTFVALCAVALSAVITRHVRRA